MPTAYMKQLIEGGEGKFTCVKLVAETEEALNEKRNTYLADAWQDATEEEFNQEFADRTAPVTSEADAALGNNEVSAAPEVTSEPVASEPVAEEAQEQGTPEAETESAPQPAPEEVDATPTPATETQPEAAPEQSPAVEPES